MLAEYSSIAATQYFAYTDHSLATDSEHLNPFVGVQMSIEPRVVEFYAMETNVGTIGAIDGSLFVVRFTFADVVNPNETV